MKYILPLILCLQLAYAQPLQKIVIGSSSNLYTALINEHNSLVLDSSTIGFVYRNNPNINGGTSGDIRYSYSTDLGLSWTNEVGPFGVGTPNRFPQIAFLDVASNASTSTQKVLMCYNYGDSLAWDKSKSTTAVLGSNLGSLDTVKKITPRSTLEFSLIEGLPNEFWKASSFGSSDFLNDSLIHLYKGVYDPISQQVVWSLHKVLNPQIATVLNAKNSIGRIKIAFSPNGMDGWLCTSANWNPNNYNFEPILFKTTDGGATWSNAIKIDLSQIPTITNEFTNNNLSTAFDIGLAVDNFGKPHFFSGISLNNGSFFISTTDVKLFDISLNGSIIIATYLDKINTLRYYTLDNYSIDNLCQASRSKDGSKIFFNWQDNELTNDQSIKPNWKARALDVNTYRLTCIRNFTKNDAILAEQIECLKIAPTAFKKGNKYIIPAVNTGNG